MTEGLTGPAGEKKSRAHLGARLGALLSIVIIGAALWFLHREMSNLSMAALLANMRAIPLASLLAAVVCAACSYLVLTGYDAAALRYVSRDMPYRTSALTSFMAFAVGHNVGIAALSGGSIRYRIYSLAGLSTADIARLIVFISSTFGLGASGLLGVALLLMPEAQTAVLKLPPSWVQIVGIVLVLVPLAYLGATLWRRTPFRIGDWDVALPRPPLALAQIGIAIGDLAFAAATLYVLLAPSLDMGYLPFLGLYLLALGAGLVSSVPGGIGVFEAVLVATLPQVNTAALLGTIIVYRLIYYVAPLSIALVFLVGYESRQHGRALRRTATRATDWLSGVAPQAIGTTVFLAGVVLLVSGASPAVETRLALIARGIPLPLLELSHLLGSVAGVGLLIVARGLFRRLRTAYLVALLVLGTGIVVSLAKGLDYEEAAVLAVIALALWTSRGEFYRRGSIAAQRFSVQWMAAIAMVLVLAVWVGMVSFRHVEYSDQLWWRFAADAQAPRMLRASVIAAVTTLAFALWKVLRAGPASVEAKNPGDDLEQARLVVQQATSSFANAALLGDKRFLWSADRTAFIMYQVSGDSWIALGDPVGPVEHHEELAWAFRELVDRHDGRPVFYQVGEASLSLYVDLGLSLAKLGEDARVPLADFSLQGSHRADLRQADNRAKKYGAVFEVLPRERVPEVIADLRRVSDSWLADKSTAEKGFSLGAFSEPYLACFDCAVVRVNDTIVAFANLWPAQAGGELSIDLMRYDQGAPKGVMDYLFAELMLWGAANRYAWFNLGMAPLSGLEQHQLAPLWHKLGHLIFTHGENFYNFEGLRSYKNKFAPQWSPRYLACPGGWWQLPRALLDASKLISGGVGGMLGKS